MFLSYAIPESYPISRDQNLKDGLNSPDIKKLKRAFETTNIYRVIEAIGNCCIVNYVHISVCNITTTDHELIALHCDLVVLVVV